MKNNQVYVVSSVDRPLMPTRRFKKVREMLKSGQAKPIKSKPFTIQLQYETNNYVQPLFLGIDPGGKEIGYSVRKDSGEIVEAGKLETRSIEVTENMTERRMYRRIRRRNHRLKRQRRAKKNKTYFKKARDYRIKGMEKNLSCKMIRPKLVKFQNRRRKKGWLTPTARHLLTTHKNLVNKIDKRLPIEESFLEFGKFDLQKINNPKIKGVEYQNGRKKGFTNTQEYVLCRDKHTCQRCGGTNVELHVHHVIWQKDGGADTPENLITLCKKCHDKVHKNSKIDVQVKEIFKGITKRQVHTNLLNTIMPSFQTWLEQKFSKVTITYGYETKDKRRKLEWDKDHHLDAYLISLKNVENIPVDWQEIEVYQYLQFRRHHRQIIHAIRDRNYKKGKKIVAKNRKQRTGQTNESLKQLVEKHGKMILKDLKVLPGKKVIRSKFKDFRKGDIVRRKGKRYVVKGYGEMGRRLGFVGCKDYVLTDKRMPIDRSQRRNCLPLSGS